MAAFKWGTTAIPAARVAAPENAGDDHAMDIDTHKTHVPQSMAPVRWASQEGTAV